MEGSGELSFDEMFKNVKKDSIEEEYAKCVRPSMFPDSIEKMRDVIRI